MSAKLPNYDDASIDPFEIERELRNEPDTPGGGRYE